MAVPDPGGVGGFGPFFNFPFVTIEDVEIVDRNTIAVLNDNNIPGTGGERRRSGGQGRRSSSSDECD